MIEDGKIRYFGYGSLVNQATRPPGSVTTPGRLHGFVRQWRAVGATSFGNVCALSISADPKMSIDGVLVEEPADRLAALDAREYRYVRKALPENQFARTTAHAQPVKRSFYYEADISHARWASDEFPILQSYVDAVMQGFYALFGEQGAIHFIESTQGWDAPMIADRNRPKYPRAVSLTSGERDLIDALLDSVGVRYLPPD